MFPPIAVDKAYRIVAAGGVARDDDDGRRFVVTSTSTHRYRVVLDDPDGHGGARCRPLSGGPRHDRRPQTCSHVAAVLLWLRVERQRRRERAGADR